VFVTAKRVAPYRASDRRRGHSPVIGGRQPCSSGITGMEAQRSSLCEIIESARIWYSKTLKLNVSLRVGAFFQNLASQKNTRGTGKLVSVNK
jgi:hypothetical protein